jgi:acyl-CoA reductase-like NAD-dependent aldehyde dehydrogenase
MQNYGHFIHGQMVQPASGEWISTVNPYTGEPWAQIARGNAADVDAAVNSAHRAFSSPEWRGITVSARAAILRRFADAVADNVEELTEIESRDNGKLIAEIRVQCGLLSEWIHYFAGLSDKVEGRIPPIEKPLQLGLVRYEPFGVCAGITPWNSPLLLLVWKLAPALAAGNTFVAKPSEYTSVSSLLLAKIACEAGLPPGVFNVVTGYGAEVGEPLVTHPLVRRVAFTGGEPGGLAVATTAARKLIPCTLELGGKSANVVFEDANLEAAVNGIVSGIFAASGQTCMAGSRALVHESIFDEVVKRLVEIAESAKLGDPRDPTTNIAPVATKPQYQKIAELIDSAISEGATLLTGGVAPQGAVGKGGWFVRPTIFSDVTPSMRIVREEVFGPVLTIMPFRDEQHAVELANSTEYGLAAGVWTKDIARAFRMSEKLEAGTVWINTYRSTSYVMPFGGYKRSGIGRENGIEAIYEYLQQKSVHVNMNEAPVANPFVRR